jgi:hypothetical protein
VIVTLISGQVNVKTTVLRDVCTICLGKGMKHVTSSFHIVFTVHLVNYLKV